MTHGVWGAGGPPGDAPAPTASLWLPHAGFSEDSTPCPSGLGPRVPPGSREAQGTAGEGLCSQQLMWGQGGRLSQQARSPRHGAPRCARGTGARRPRLWNLVFQVCSPGGRAGPCSSPGTRRAHAHPEAVPLLPSRSPCRPCPRLSARPRRGAAGTAREGWDTPGERCPCRTRGKRRSTLEKRRSTSGTPRGSSHGRRKRSRPSSNSVPTEAQGPRPG